jgi:hypothetical protein
MVSCTHRILSGDKEGEANALETLAAKHLELGIAAADGTADSTADGTADGTADDSTEGGEAGALEQVDRKDDGKAGGSAGAEAGNGKEEAVRLMRSAVDARREGRRQQKQEQKQTASITSEDGAAVEVPEKVGGEAVQEEAGKGARALGRSFEKLAETQEAEDVTEAAESMIQAVQAYREEVREVTAAQSGAAVESLQSRVRRAKSGAAPPQVDIGGAEQGALESLSRTLFSLGRMKAVQRDLSGALAALDEARETCERRKDKTGEAHAAKATGAIKIRMGDTKGGQAAYEQALALCTSIGDMGEAEAVRAQLDAIGDRRVFAKQHARKEEQAADEAKRRTDISLQKAEEKEQKQAQELLQQQHANYRKLWGVFLLLLLLLLVAVLLSLKDGQDL